MIRPHYPCLRAFAVAIALALPALLAQDEAPARRGARDAYPEPTVDLSLPVGVPQPPFQGEIPKGAAVVQRTGTYGGVLIDSEAGEIDTFNPVDPKGAASQETSRLLFSTLVSYRNAAWEHAPGLAESWQVHEDKKTWVFTLREGVRWSDGEPLTVEDVVFSFKAIFHPKIPCSAKDSFRDLQGRFPSYRALDPRRIEFVTTDVDAAFLIKVGSVYIIPRHKWGSHLEAEHPTLLEQMTNAMDPRDMVGTGPFVLKQYVPAEKILFERNPHYWKIDARGQRLPYLDGYTVALVKDMNLQWQKFEAGEHDVIKDISVDHYKEAAALEEKDAITLARLGVNVNTYWLAWNLHVGKDPATGKPFVSPIQQRWFHNRMFRVAMNHAVDRAGIVKSAMQGRGRPIWSMVTPGNRAWFHPGVARYEFDPAQARKILDDLGWKDTDGDGVREDDQGHPIAFEINTNVENPTRQQMGTLIQKYLRDVGVNATFRPLAFNDLVTSLQDSHRWEVMILGWGSSVPPDPSLMKNILTSSGRLHVWHPRQETPATEWERQVDELVERTDRELDPAERKKHSDRVQELIAEHIPIFYLVAPNAYAAHKKHVGNVWPSVLRPQLTWNIEELFLRRP